MKNAELIRKSREMTEKTFRDGLIKTFIEIAFMSVIGGLGCIALILLFWEYVLKPLVESGHLN